MAGNLLHLEKGYLRKTLDFLLEPKRKPIFSKSLIFDLYKTFRVQEAVIYLY